MSSRTRLIDSPYAFARNSNYLNGSRVGGSPLSKILHITPQNGKDYKELNENFIKKKLIYKSKDEFEPELVMKVIMDISAEPSNFLRVNPDQLKQTFKLPGFVDKNNLSRIKGRPAKYFKIRNL